MSASSKFDLSSGSPNRPLYTSGHRGSYTAASLDRSSSTRENMENPLLSSLPNMTRSTSSITQGDVMNYFQCVRFDPKSMVVDHKLNRPVEFERLASAALGIPLDDSPQVSSKSKSSPSPEDLRRLKAGVRESGTRARERVKIFSDCLSVLNKCFPSIPSRRRSRLDALSNDRSNVLLATDRSSSGTGVSKIGSQNHASTSGFEMEQQKSEERTKTTFPNKRKRTSMVDGRIDVRANTPAKASGTVDKDREILRIPNSSAAPGEDQTFSTAIDGWEKSKMKKKRTGINNDISASSIASKPNDGYRETKQGMRPRLSTEARSKLSDSHGFRHGVTTGSSGVGKAEATLQQSGLSMRAIISGADSDCSPIPNERRDRPTGLEKERVNLKAMNKMSAREELIGRTSGSKLNSNTRAPRSGSVGAKFSQVVQRAVPSNDWELSNCTSKNSGPTGASNRKRTPSVRSSSPPVANWVQRPQKISRAARRTNLVAILPANDETLVETTSEVGNERRLSGNSPQHVKLRCDNFSSAGLSESEESGAAETKSRERSKKCNGMDEKAGQNVQKLSTLELPPRKNKVVSGDDLGEGVRRQGRTGRNFTSSRAFMPLTVEKLGSVGTVKQIRSARVGFDKTESKSGRPPTRKLSERKAYARQKHAVVGTDFLVGSDNGHEELLAAANAVTNTVQTLSSRFWKQMEPVFRFIADNDIAYLKDQVNLGSAVGTAAVVPRDADSSSLVPISFCSNEPARDESETKSAELSPDHFASAGVTPKEISLYQRLIAALIPEERNLELACNANDDLGLEVYGSRFEIEKDAESDAAHPRLLESRGHSGYSTSNDYRINANGKSCEQDQALTNNYNNGHISMTDLGFIQSYDHSRNVSLSDQTFSGVICSEDEYSSMPMDERLLMEIHSIGLYPDLVPDLTQTGDEEITEDLSKLDEKYQQQVLRKKSLVGKLLTSASDSKELQERDFEKHALDKLVGMAYEKYKNCWVPNAHGMKSASGKIAKQAALGFVKRTLERCQEFEATGKSCFADSMYRDIFLSQVSRLVDGQPVNVADDESSKPRRSTSGCSVEVRNSAPLGSQQSPSNNQEMCSSEALLAGSEQATAKEESWSNRVKKRELLLLDDVGGTVSTTSGIPSGIASSLSSSAKGRRSEREREGKGSSREVLSRSGTTKVGRSVSSNIKGERKSKARPKQKVSQLSVSVNVPHGKMAEQPRKVLSSTPKTSEVSRSGIFDEEKYGNRCGELEDPIDLSNLQLPEMDDLGVPGDLGGQGEDIGSWLNIEDDGLQDHDYIGGLEIPMDDLSDLNMMV